MFAFASLRSHENTSTLSWITARFIVEQHREIGFVARLALLGLIIGASVLVIVLSVVNGFQRELETKVLSNFSGPNLDS